MTAGREVLLAPHQSEKATALGARHQTYVFRVARDADSAAIRRAVEQRYGVAVASVRTLVGHGKLRRRGQSIGRLPKVKKAYVALKGDGRIDFLAEQE